MLRPLIDFEVCQACERCEARQACKTRAIVRTDADEPPYIALDRCSGCAACVKACSCGAISMRQSGTAVSNTSSGLGR